MGDNQKIRNAARLLYEAGDVFTDSNDSAEHYKAAYELLVLAERLERNAA